MTAVTTITYPITYPNRMGEVRGPMDLRAGAKVWLDKIIGFMGDGVLSDPPIDYSRFGWFVDNRGAVENVLYSGLLLARRGADQGVTPEPLVLYTRADTALDQGQTRHTVTSSVDADGTLTVNWTAEIV